MRELLSLHQQQKKIRKRYPRTKIMNDRVCKFLINEPFIGYISGDTKTMSIPLYILPLKSRLYYVT